MSAVSNAILRLTIDSSAAKQGSAEFNSAANSTKASAKEAAAAVDQVTNSIKNAGASAGKSGADVAGFAQKMNTSMKQATESQNAMAGATKLSAYQLNLLSYQIQDVVAQLSTGTSVIRIAAQQGGQFAQAFGGFEAMFKRIITPATAFYAVIGGGLLILARLVAQTESVNRTFTAMQAQLAVTGRASEISVTQLKLLVGQMAQLDNVTRDSAVSALQAFTSARTLGGKQIVELTKIIGDYAAAIGKDVPTASQELSKALRDPTQFAAALSDTFGKLSVEQFRQIEAAQKSGQMNKALDLVIQSLSGSVKGAAANAITPMTKATEDLAKAWHDLTSTFGDIKWVNDLTRGLATGIQAIADFLKSDSPQERLNKKLDSLISDKAEITASLNSPYGTSDSRAADSRELSRIAQQMKEVQDQRRALIGITSGTEGNGVGGTGAAGVGTGVAQISSLLDKYGGLAKQIADVNSELTALTDNRKKVAEGSDSWRQYSLAIANAQAQLAALKDPAILANEALAREADILAKPIAEREVYRAKIEATANAMQQGLRPQQAYQIGLDAEAKAMLGLRAAYNDNLKSLDQQIKANEALAKATAEGPMAAARQKAANAALAEATKSLAVNVDELTRKNLELQKSQDAVSYAAALQQGQQQLQLAQQSMSLVGRSKDQREIELNLAKQRLDIEKQMPSLGKEQVDALIAVSAEQMKLNQQADALNTIYDDARTSLSDTFSQVLQGGITKFSDFGNAVKNIFIKLAAQIAQLLVFQPIINSIGGELGIGGFSSGAGSVVSGGSALGGSGGLFSGLSSLIGDSVSNAINGFGTNLGFGSGLAAAAPSASFVGPMPLASGSIFGTTTLSGFLGGVGAGFGAGGLLNSLVGGNSTGGTIGSGVGSVAGAAIGSIVPGIGTLLGGLIGGAGGGLFGGLFGPKKSVGPNANTNLNIRSGRFAVGETGADNGGDRAGTIQLAQNAVDQLNKLVDTYGIAAYDPYGGALSKTGAPHAIGFEVYTGNVNAGKPQTPDDVLKFALAHGLFKSTAGGVPAGDFKTNVLYGTGGSSDPYQRVINNTKATTIADFAKDLDIAKLIVDAKNAASALDDVQKGFKDLSTQAGDYIARGKQLGFANSEIYGALASNLNKQVSDTIAKIEDPYQVALDTLIKDQNARLEYAKKIGADTTQIEKLNLLEQKQLMEQYGKDTTAALKQMGDDLKKYLNGELLGSNSSLSPYDQFKEAQKQFGSVIDTARKAGANADIGSVTSAADQLLALGRNALGGATGDYSTLEDLVRSMITELGKQLKLPGFAVGGSMQVLGSGGTDSQVVAMRVTPGETIDVSTPAQKGNEQAGLGSMVMVLQTELRALQKEVKGVNRNLTATRNYAGVVRQ